MSKFLLYPCAFAALSALPLAADEKESAIPARAPAEAGTPATFSWVDIEGDGRLELAAVSADGGFQLLAAAGEDRFEDVSERVGLAGIRDAALALWVDYDADGRLDLFVGARAGASRLFRNEGGSFVDMTAGAGLAIEGGVRSSDWLDHDGDGRADLHVVTAERHELYRGLEGGFFERAELPLLGAESVAGPGGVVITEASPETPSAPGPSSDEVGPRGSVPGVDGARGTRQRVSPGSQSPGGAAAITIYPASCAASIKDQANPGNCVQASTTPTLGKLYPISTNLFVAVSGDVGVGTTSPSAKLHVAGTARITDTLTLAPSGDVAVDVSTGSVYKGGVLFMHTKGGVRNTALGKQALSSVTSGATNTAMGYRALRSNTTGYSNMATGPGALELNTTGSLNTASGSYALQGNTTGNRNTANGAYALYINTSGSFNTASGAYALESNTANGNTATGAYALRNNMTGYDNTANGRSALRSNTTGSDNTAVGSYALRVNTASGNTASGAEALRLNTTGTANTANGRGALRANTTGSENTATGYRALDASTGLLNTAHGASALRDNTSGNSNTAHGARALRSNTTGSFNTGVGRYALRDNTSGIYNTATGINALSSNTTASGNTAHGSEALGLNTGANNTASGFNALRNNTSGSRNIAVGKDAGIDLTTGSDNIHIGNVGVAGEGATIRIGDTDGTQTRAFVAGIRGVTTGVGDAITVMIDSAGQLGTVSSSRRFKQDIADMGDRTERLLDLRPVVFHYKEQQVLPDGSEVPLEYGLIAEEVAEIFPELVVFDEEGQPFTVKYHLLSAMLLNELKDLRAESADHAGELEELREQDAQRVSELNELRTRLARVEGRAAPAAPTAATR